MKQYAERDHEALCEHYLRHVEAMTAEGLHEKSAIAGELAWRDAEIERLQGVVTHRESELLRCRTAENHAAATLDVIRAELRLPAGCVHQQILNGVIGLAAHAGFYEKEG